MKTFDYFQPTIIKYGAGRINEVAVIVREYGTRSLVVTTPPEGPLGAMYERVINILKAGGMWLG